MFFRILFFFIFSTFLLTSQESSLNHDSSILKESYFFEINNIGDPILFLNLSDSINFFLHHTIEKVRKVDYFEKPNLILQDSVFSSIYYQKCYNEGGRLKGFVRRPIGSNILLNALYDNLSSKGFYINQHNKYSKLYFSIDFLSYKNPYSFSIDFLSINGNYQQYGGLLDFDSSLSSELMPIQLNSAMTIIRNRKVDFSQQYKFHSNLFLKHNFSTKCFDRNYINPSDSMIQNDTLKTFFTTISNNISLLKKSFSLSITHNYYNTNDLKLNPLGDIVLSFSNTNFIRKNKNIQFFISFFPIGYNQNNYLVDLNLYKKTLKFNHIFSANFSKMKPDFFIQNYFKYNDLDWNNFSPSSVLTLKVKSTLNKRKLTGSFLFKRFLKYMYFNELAIPFQSNNPVQYLNFKLKKSWFLSNFLFNSTFCFQYSDNTAISLPMFLYHQKITYTKNIFTDIMISASLSGYVFSPYYASLFDPVSDVFYQQFETKKSTIPFLSADLKITKANFSLGFIVENIHSIISQENYVSPTYALPISPIFILSINWMFLD